jgi:processive 1,2-diacylglycerol beta-glucosyltransferase
MKKVLILSASFGDGHNTAARNIREALEQVSQDVKVEIVDLLQESYGSFYNVVRKAHLRVVAYAPLIWSGIYSVLDRSSLVGRNLAGAARIQKTLERILAEMQPDCVVSTYPLYGQIIAQLFQDHHDRPFRFVTVITDAISVNSIWYRSGGDHFCVADNATAEVLIAGGVPREKVKALGFPVSPQFGTTIESVEDPKPGEPRKLLYIINSGKKKAGKSIDRLLEIPDTMLTITVGRDAELKAKIVKRTRHLSYRVKVIGWTNQMPQLLMSHHLVIGKAGGATVQEAIAARCPMIVNQVIPGQEQGNARLIAELRLGAVAEKNRDVADIVANTFSCDAVIWRIWRENMRRLSKPDASFRIAELILAECDNSTLEPNRIALFTPVSGDSPDRPARPRQQTLPMICDFHIHTNYSDGKLTAPEVVDFYGKLGFDCICITDHLADPRRLIGKMTELCNVTLGQDQIEEYYTVIERERIRAWKKYNMLVMTGIEFNKDGFTKKSSAHLLGIDLKYPINPALDLPETIAQIHLQKGLAVASHPHIMESEWGKNTLYLWEHQDKFAPLLDAWEIANRNNIFNRVGLKRLPFIANSDFHKPKHIYSWKTLLHCEKHPDAIKECIRENRNVAITLYRDELTARSLQRQFEHEAEIGEQLEAVLQLAY